MLMTAILCSGAPGEGSKYSLQYQQRMAAHFFQSYGWRVDPAYHNHLLQTDPGYR